MISNLHFLRSSARKSLPSKKPSSTHSQSSSLNTQLGSFGSYQSGTNKKDVFLPLLQTFGSRFMTPISIVRSETFSNTSPIDFKRTYAKSSTKSVVKKKSKSIKNSSSKLKTIEIPATIREHVGELSATELEELIKKDSVDIGEDIEAAEDINEDDFDEEDDFDFEEEDLDLEDVDESLDFLDDNKKRRKRRPPPFVPGRVTLDSENWTSETKDCLVEYTTKDELGNTLYHLGIVRRPKGVRHWGIVDLETQNESKINMYKITFQWPANPETGLNEISIDEAKQIKSESDELFASIIKKPSSIWKIFVSSNLSSQRSIQHQVSMIPNTKSQRASGKVVRIEPPKTESLQNQNLVVDGEMPDSIDYIDLIQASRVLFDIGEDQQVSNIHIYTTHRFLEKHDIFFGRNVHRGFFCRSPELVLFRLTQKRLAQEDAQIRENFVEKIKPLLEQQKSMEALNDLNPVSVKSRQISSLNSSESDSTSLVDAVNDIIDTTVFDSNDEKFLEQIKRYALSSDDSMDADLIANILKPLGFGDKPHHAFDLLVQLGLLSKFDNPHLLRWHGPLNFTESQIKLASEIIEFTDGPETLLPDPDASNRVDFTNVPTFAIDDSYAQEIDDAISLYTDQQNRDWVYVHVTDVSRYIEPDSILDLAARERSSAIFLPDVTYGIFPDILREHLSLGGKSQVPDHEAELKKLQSEMNVDPEPAQPKRFLPKTLQESSASRLLSMLSEQNNANEKKSNFSVSGQSKAQNRGKQPALSFGALIDGGGKIEEWQVVNSYIGNVQKITYEQLNEILVPKPDEKQSRPLLGTGQSKQNGAVEPSMKAIALAPLSDVALQLKKQHYNVFLRLLDLATKRRSFRLDNRAVIASYPKPDVHITVDATGKAVASVGVQPDFVKNSRGLVTEFMLMAGQIAGTFSKINQIPIYYQSQNVRGQDRERSLLDVSYQASILSLNPKAKGPEIMKNVELLRLLSPKVVTTMPTNNDALGLPWYVSVTSPLRRYMDLIAHYQIKAALRRKTAPFTLRALHDIGTDIQSRQVEVAGLNKNGTRFWILGCIQELIKSDPYRKFQAVVVQSRTDTSKEEARVLLLDFALENNLTVTRQMFKGESIWVKVEMVNPFYNTLILKETKGVAR